MTLPRVDGVRWERLRVDGVDRWRAVASTASTSMALPETPLTRHTRHVVINHVFLYKFYAIGARSCATRPDNTHTNKGQGRQRHGIKSSKDPHVSLAGDPSAFGRNSASFAYILMRERQHRISSAARSSESKSSE